MRWDKTKKIMQKKLRLSIYNELYVIDCDMVMYLQADDHYTIVQYATGAHFTVPFGLSKVEEAIAELQNGQPDESQNEEEKFLVRVGRKYIINLRRIFHINTMKQVVVLSDNHGNNHTISLPKPILRSLIELLNKKHTEET